jgi:hypothetical protein
MKKEDKQLLEENGWTVANHSDSRPVIFDSNNLVEGPYGVDAVIRRLRAEEVDKTWEKPKKDPLRHMTRLSRPAPLGGLMAHYLVRLRADLQSFLERCPRGVHFEDICKYVIDQGYNLADREMFSSWLRVQFPNSGINYDYRKK